MQDEIEKIIHNLDANGDGRINYTEFLIATLEVKKYLSDDMIKALFTYFDTDHNGAIT